MATETKTTKTILSDFPDSGDYLKSADAYTKQEIDTKDASSLTAAKEYADKKITELIDGAPETLDTLKEIAETIEAGGDAMDALVVQVGKKVNNTVNISYSELVALEGEYIPGQSYRITDYVTKTRANNCYNSAENAFDIIVTALDINTLSENAKATFRSRDNSDYFYSKGVKVESWDIKYCIKNDHTRFAWVDSSCMGAIYYMKDEFGNECPYDFKNIRFNYTDDGYAIYDCYTFSEQGDLGYDTSLSAGNKIFNNVVKEYKAGGILQLNRNLFIGKDFSCNFIDASCYDNIFYSTLEPDGDSEKENNCHWNYIGICCYKNLFQAGAVSNKLGNNCYSNSFSNNCRYNELSDNCYRNSFGNSCLSNVLGHDCNENTFGNSCSRNTLDAYSRTNTLANSCIYNVFGKNCHSNELGNGCGNNTFGNDNYDIVMGDDCDYNWLGNGCREIRAGSGCSKNMFKGSCYKIFMGSQCAVNEFGLDCHRIVLGESESVPKNKYAFNKFETGVYYINLNTTEVDTKGNVRFYHLHTGVIGASETYKTLDCVRNRGSKFVFRRASEAEEVLA